MDCNCNSYWKKIDNKIEILNCGVSDAMGAIVATSAVVGFGGVAKLTAGYTTLVNIATGMGGSPLLSFSLELLFCLQHVVLVLVV